MPDDSKDVYDKQIEESKSEVSVNNHENGSDCEPFFQVLMNENRSRVLVQGLLNNANISQNAAEPDFSITKNGDSLILFNDTHVLKKMGLVKIECDEEMQQFIKP